VWARRRAAPAPARIENLRDETVTDASGAVRSVQAADLFLTESQLDAIWSPTHLERLARTYWRFLARVTLGLVRVAYTPTERFVVLLARPLVLLRFQAPEYEMDARRGVVRWRIERGLLVSARGRGGDGYLQIDVRRGPPPASQPPDAGRVAAHVEVEVANFYPSIASGLGGWLYEHTQSRVHVLVTQSFLRSLARLDLAESRVGRFARPTLPDVSVAQVPDPPPHHERAAVPGRARSGSG
jgi:hypothetical protein